MCLSRPLTRSSLSFLQVGVVQVLTRSENNTLFLAVRPSSGVPQFVVENRSWQHLSFRQRGCTREWDLPPLASFPYCWDMPLVSRSEGQLQVLRDQKIRALASLSLLSHSPPLFLSLSLCVCLSPLPLPLPLSSLSLFSSHNLCRCECTSVCRHLTCTRLAAANRWAPW